MLFFVFIFRSVHAPICISRLRTIHDDIYSLTGRTDLKHKFRSLCFKIISFFNLDLLKSVFASFSNMVRLVHET